VVRIEAPGTIDGGDVLRVGRRIWVGQSRRTNASGLEQLRAIAAPLGYRVEAVPVAGCLHLKSAVTAVAPTVLLVNPAWLADKWDPASAGFDAFDLIEVDPLEPHAANALLVGDRLVYPTAFPRTLARLRARGLDPLLVEVSEIAKAEGAVTCCSLIVEQGGL
jgi:dimethylargininase